MTNGVLVTQKFSNGGFDLVYLECIHFGQALNDGFSIGGGEDAGLESIEIQQEWW